jgi:hypothetical protein
VSHAVETRLVARVFCSARWVRHEHTIGVVCARLDPFAADETRRRTGHTVLFDALLDVGAVRIVHDLRYGHATTRYSADSEVTFSGQEGPAGETADLSGYLNVCTTWSAVRHAVA